MKKISVLIIVLYFSYGLMAQTSGVINFTETIKLHMEMPGQDPEMMKKIPQTHSVQKVLYFQGGESLYKNNLGNQDLEVNNNDQHGGEIRMVMKSPENTLYADVKNNVMINSQEFFGKLFLINGENKKQLWKITGEQKTLLDYTCVKAMLQDTTNTVAWFTTKLPANMGPNGFTGLPGMIMMVDIDNGERIYVASKIELRDLAEGEMTKPEKGKKVSGEEFEKIKKEKMEEMGAVQGKGGTFKVMIREERN